MKFWHLWRDNDDETSEDYTPSADSGKDKKGASTDDEFVIAHCCNPLPGDEIIGFVTKGHGISIHKKDCLNYLNAVKSGSEPERWLEAHWDGGGTSSGTPIYKVTLDIVASESILLLAEVSKTLAEMHVPVTEISVKELKNGNSSLFVSMSTGGITQLNTVISKIKKLPSVISVERAGAAGKPAQ